jgi:hypothetical protein
MLFSLRAKVFKLGFQAPYFRVAGINRRAALFGFFLKFYKGITIRRVFGDMLPVFDQDRQASLCFCEVMLQFIFSGKFWLSSGASSLKSSTGACRSSRRNRVQPFTHL